MNVIDRAWKLLQEVSDARGSLAKKRLIQEAIDEDWPVRIVLEDFFVYSQDPFRTYGVKLSDKDVEEIDQLHNDRNFHKMSDQGAEEWWLAWVGFLDRLSRREITGNKAREKLIEALAVLDDPSWAIQMLNANYTIGFSAMSVEEIFPGRINWFSCQLATEWDKQTVPANAIIEPKFDGVRGLLCIEEDGSWAFLSRNGKPLANVGHIVGELAPAFRGCVLDGELFGTDWASSISAVRSHERGDKHARFQIFDFIDLREFKKLESSPPLSERKLAIRRRFDNNFTTKVTYSKVVDYHTVRTPEEVLEWAQRFREAGFEGGVLKDMDAPYSFARDGSWMKVKEFLSGDYPIVDVQEGRGRLEGSLGALIVQGPGGVLSGVGSGFSDDQRHEYWSKRKQLIGKTVEVVYQELTPDGALRFPTFHRLRPDKD